MNLYCGSCIVVLGVEETNAIGMQSDDAPPLTPQGRPHRKAITVIGGVALCHTCVGIDQARRISPTEAHC